MVAAQRIKNGTFRPLVSCAGVSQFRQLFAQGTQFLQLLIKIDKMFLGQRLYIRALAVRVIQKIDQRAAFFKGKAKHTSAAQEHKTVHVARAIVTIAIGTARRFGQQADLFVIANGLGRNLRSLCQFTNIHHHTNLPIKHGTTGL